MSKLTILQWPAGKREVHFVGYNRDHTACLIRDEQNTRRAITLSLPKAFDLHFRENPIGKAGSPPIEINRAALHVPACFSSQEEKAAFDDPNSMEMQNAKVCTLDLWKALTRHKCWLDPKHDKKLSKLLREELDRHRRLYAIRQKETAEQTSAINLEIAALGPSNTAHVLQFHQNRITELQNMLRAEFTIDAWSEHDSSKLISIFDASPDMVRRGWAGLREKLLEQEWAECLGLNLQKIPTEAASFHAWLEKRAYNGTKEIGLGLKLAHWQWGILEAAVSYEVRFADGTRCWLDEIEERAFSDRLEVEDFERIEEAGPQESNKDERLPLDVVLQRLGTDWKKKGFVAMGVRGFKTLCDREAIKFEEVQKRGLKRGDLDKLLKKRASQIRKRKSHLGKHNKSPAGHDKPTRSMHDESEAPDEGRIKVGGSLDQLESKLRALDNGKKETA